MASFDSEVSSLPLPSTGVAFVREEKHQRLFPAGLEAVGWHPSLVPASLHSTSFPGPQHVRSCFSGRQAAAISAFPVKAPASRPSAVELGLPCLPLCYEKGWREADSVMAQSQFVKLPQTLLLLWKRMQRPVVALNRLLPSATL